MTIPMGLSHTQLRTLASELLGRLQQRDLTTRNYLFAVARRNSDVEFDHPTWIQRQAGHPDRFGHLVRFYAAALRRPGKTPWGRDLVAVASLRTDLLVDVPDTPQELLDAPPTQHRAVRVDLLTPDGWLHNAQSNDQPATRVDSVHIPSLRHEPASDAPSVLLPDWGQPMVDALLDTTADITVLRRFCDWVGLDSYGDDETVTSRILEHVAAAGPAPVPVGPDVTCHLSPAQWRHASTVVTTSHDLVDLLAGRWVFPNDTGRMT